MRLSRVLPLMLVVGVAPLWPATAQCGGIPGMQSSAGMGSGTPGSSLGASQQGSSPACQPLMSVRDETREHGKALQAAGKKAGLDELCKLFKAYLAAEGKMIKALEERSAACGVPADVIKQVKSTHGKASETGKRICEVAMPGPRPTPVRSGDFWTADELQRLFGW